jgi:endogenous inhibitor of DNA gyrase (YacG/DUF329 family)
VHARRERGLGGYAAPDAPLNATTPELVPKKNAPRFKSAEVPDLVRISGNADPQPPLRCWVGDTQEGKDATMSPIRTLAASAAILMSVGVSAGVPAFAQTLDAAQCATAKGTGDQNAIRQFCPESDWPQTVEPGAALDDSATNAVNEAQCSDAKGSGDVVAIQQFCPQADWPDTMSTGGIAPAENTVDAAQCGNAKNSGDQNAIRQFCPESDWPQTVE